MVFSRRRSISLFIIFIILNTTILVSFFISIYSNYVRTRNDELERDSYLLGEWIKDSFDSSAYILKNIIQLVPVGDLEYPPSDNAKYSAYKEQISETIGSFPYASFYGVIDNNGILAYSNSVDGYSLVDKLFFIEMKNNPAKEAVLSNIFKSPEGYLYIVHGVNYDPDNTEFKAMAVMGVSLSFFDSWISKLDYKGSGKILIVDENGTILAHNSSADENSGDTVHLECLRDMQILKTDFEVVTGINSAEKQRRVTAVRKISGMPFFIIIDEQSGLFSYMFFPVFLLIIGFAFSTILAYELLKAHFRQRTLNSTLKNMTIELQTIFDHSMVGIILLDSDLKIVRANTRFAEIAGYNSIDEAIGHSISETHISFESYKRFASYYRRELNKRGIVEIESEFKKIDGTSVWCRVFGKTIDNKLPPDLAKGIIWIVDDITVRRQAKQKLLEMATMDEQTGLNNRRHFMELGDRELAIFERHHRPVSVLLMDLDHFKNINDSFSHSAGDLVIAHFASVCLQNIRTGDISGRIGGEEFAIILPDTGIESALEVAERIRTTTEKSVLYYKNNELKYTVSIGIAAVEKNMPLRKLLHNADTAMYDSKNSGRNRVTVYSADKNTE